SSACWWDLGGEDAAVPFLGKVPLVDRALATSAAKAAQDLNSGRLWCSKACCLAYSSPSDARIGVLFQESRHSEALSQLGVLSEMELFSTARHHAWQRPGNDSTAQAEEAKDSFTLEVSHGQDHLGFTLDGLPPKPQLHIFEVKRNSWAARSGIKKGDRLALVGDRRARDFESGEFRRMLSTVRPLRLTFARVSQPSPCGRDPLAQDEALLRSQDVWDTGMPLPRSWLLAREMLALLLGAAGGSFDARSRAALLGMFCHLGVPPKLSSCWEFQLGGALFEALEATSILQAQKEKRKSWNRSKMALATAGGGLLLAVTGGLAAPIVAPALAAGAAAVGSTAAAAATALGLAQTGIVVGGAIAGFGTLFTSLGTAGAVALFGATGAGLTSWKMSRRWGDLKEFSFEPLASRKWLVKEVIEIADTETARELDAAVAANFGQLAKDAVVPLAGGGLAALRKGSELVRRETVLRPESGSASSDPFVRYHFQHQIDQALHSVHLVLFVSGWIRDRSDFYDPWNEAAQTFFPSSGHLALQWETKELLDMSAVFGQMIVSEAASSTASFWMKSTAAAGMAAGSLAAMTIAWPVWIVSSMANLDNAWLVCVERARLAGKCLAHVLADRHNVGQRPVTLVGHSMGARLLVYCLLELYSMGEFHAVDDVILLGTPVTTGASKWRQVRAVASGRVINGYLKSDWILAFLYRYLEWGVSVAGLSEVKVPGIENFNLEGLGISGHTDYPRHVANILAKMRIGERQEPPLSVYIS
ncbi:unnamed protein product, partial [Polarella glacialis]